jgi:hypothetical protein
MSRKSLIPLIALAFFAAPVLNAANAESAAKTTTVKSSKSNTSDRMGGGGGKGKASRMGGGGGKGAVGLNPQPEPPGRAKSR